MAKQTNVNLSPATGAVSMYEWTEFLVNDLGFEILEESDGSTYEADVPTNGRQITGGGAGAGGFANSNAWCRIRDATGSGGREWTVQRDTANNTDWRVKASALDGFTGGSPGATQTPSATDEQILIGSGTDASPNHAQLFPTDGSYRLHLVGFDVAEDGVFPWYLFTADSGTGLVRTLFMCDSLDPNSYPALVGTRATPTSGEPDPAIYAAAYDSASDPFLYGDAAGQWGNRTTPPGQGWFAMNGSNGNTEAFVVFSAAGYHFQLGLADRAAPADSGAGDGFGPNPLDGSDQKLSILYGRSAGYSTQVLAKGLSGHLAWKLVDRDYPDLMDIGSERFVYAGDLLIPFENGTTPLT